MLEAGKNFHFLNRANLLFFQNINFSVVVKLGNFTSDYTVQTHTFRKFTFCETLSSIITKSSVCSKVRFPKLVLLRILSIWIIVDLHKTRGYIMAISEILFHPANLPPAIRYDKLFKNLPKLE